MTINSMPDVPALLLLPRSLVTDPLMVVLDVDKVDMAPQILTAGALLQVNTKLKHPDNVPIQLAMLCIRVFVEAFAPLANVVVIIHIGGIAKHHLQCVNMSDLLQIPMSPRVLIWLVVVVAMVVMPSMPLMLVLPSYDTMVGQMIFRYLNHVI